MFDEFIDQAAGLRRMLATPKPRRITVLSTLNDADRHAMLANLAASLAKMGGDTLLVDARTPCPMQEPALMDVAAGRRALGDAVFAQASGAYAKCSMSHGIAMSSAQRHTMDGAVGKVLDQLSVRYVNMLIDAELDAQGDLPVSALQASTLLVHVTDDEQSIKQGYALIKRIQSSTGRMDAGTLVSGADESRARLIYANLSQTASRYLAVTLRDMGFIPQDDFLRRAIKLGRPVVDVFPSAVASLAFRRVAGQLSMT